MKSRADKNSSFRVRMVVFSTLVAAIGLLGFALLALGFYQRELRKNLDRDLRGALIRTGPAILRFSGKTLSSMESRMAGRVFGRLEEFGAVYAVLHSDTGWQLSEDWPIRNEEYLDQMVSEIPPDPRRSRGIRERVESEGVSENRDREIEPIQPPSSRGGKRRPDQLNVLAEGKDVYVFSGSDLPGRWIFAGMEERGAAVLLAVPNAIYGPQMRGLIAVFFLASPLALGLVALCAWFFSSRAIAPIRKLTSVASETTADNLSRRISGEGMEKEFRELVDVFNGMLERLEKSFGQARRFGQDAAHELNTPLTILTAKVDEAVVEAEDGSPEQLRLGEVADELGHLREIVRKLHLLARIDGGGLRPERREVDLSQLVADMVEELREAFPSVHFSFQSQDAVTISCDPALVRQIVLNLLSNACSYNRADGSIRVELAQGDGEVRLSVKNTGPAIPPEFRETIFDRFTRGDASRTNRSGTAGLGLGLSLSQEFARAHGGDLVLESGEEDEICFVLHLPDASL
ncbi:MAG: sensor histidine kinase [Puniceicoccales bacterium]